MFVVQTADSSIAKLVTFGCLLPFFLHAHVQYCAIYQCDNNNNNNDNLVGLT